MIRTKQTAPVKSRGKPSADDLSMSMFVNRAAMEAAKREAKKPVGRPPSGKIIVTLRLDPAVVAKFKAGGPGWQARMNDALRNA